MSRLSTTRTPKSGSTPDSETGPSRPTAPDMPWRGIVTLNETPIPPGEEGLALYNELWSKIRWAIGTAYKVPYTKTVHPLGELSRRLALLALANMARSSSGTHVVPDFRGRKKEGAA